MSFDNVPLMIGGGEAMHSAELIRMLIWSVFRGQEGFLTSAGGVVLPLNTPGRGIRVTPSPFVVNSRSPGGLMQAYLDRIIDAETKETTDVPPGPMRYDLVAVVIKDPYPSGGEIWPYPGPPGSDARKFGPYVGIEIIENVPANTVALEQVRPNWTGLALARLHRPGNTGTVEASMIKRLTPVCNPMTGIQLPQEVIDNIEDAVSNVQGTVAGIASGRIPIPGQYVDSRECVADSGTANRLYYTDTSYKTWPREAVWNDIFVPTWATHGEVQVIVIGPYQKATTSGKDAHIWGDTRLQLNFGDNYAFTNPTKFDSDEINAYDNRAPSAGTSTAYEQDKRPGNRPLIMTTGPIAIPSSLRGKKCTGKLQARMASDANTRGQLIADNSTAVRLEITFKEKPN